MKDGIKVWYVVKENPMVTPHVDYSVFNNETFDIEFYFDYNSATLGALRRNLAEKVNS